MIKKFVEQWDKYKDDLRAEIATRTDHTEWSYQDLFTLLCKVVINGGDIPSYQKLDTFNITKIDYGDYQGTIIFIIPLDTYQPSSYDTFYTVVEYGSCSGCDTLQSIQANGDYGETVPNATQVNDYMELCLHMLQRFHAFEENE